jgi:hypothetical protein
MLGKNADHFMRMQARERVSAMSPNGGGKSFSPPDMERAGAPQVSMRGGMGIPGPQRAISGGSIPGMGFVRAPRRPQLAGVPRGALPGMSGVFGIDRSGALPGMGAYSQPSGSMPGMGNDPSGALPGMGALGAIFGLSGTTMGLMAGGAVLAFVGYKMMAKKK